MDAEILRLTTRLESEGKKTQEFFASLTEEQLETSIYADGAVWNVRQILAHFVATEIAILDLVQTIVRGGKGIPDDFELDRFNQARVDELAEASAPDLIQAFGECREKMAVFVGSLCAADLEKTGAHPFLGLASIEDIVKLVYRHIQIHIRDIRRTI